MEKKLDINNLRSRDYHTLSYEEKKYLCEHTQINENNNIGFGDTINVVDDLDEFIAKNNLVKLSDIDKHIHF